MAELQNRQTPRYRTNGSAAYDVRRYGNAAPEIRRPGLPEERRQPTPARRVRVRAKTEIAPLAVLGLVATVGMLILVVFSYVRLYEATAEVGRLNEELAALSQEQQALTSEYEGKIDLAAIEQRARELGMVQPTDATTVYLNLSGSDRAEVLSEESPGLLESVIGAFKSSVESLVSYLS